MFARIQARLILLFSALVVVAGGSVVLWQQSENAKTELLLRDKTNEKSSLTRALTDLRGSSLQTVAYDYTYWDDMVSFVSTQDAAWAAENIAASAATYQFDFAAVYSKSLQRVYAFATDQYPLLTTDTSLNRVVQQAFMKQLFCHLFAPTASGLVEIRTAPIQLTSDQDRVTPPYGFFVVARVWSDSYVKELGRLAEVTVEVKSADYADSDMSSEDRELRGDYCFVIPLSGLDGEPVAQLHCTATSNVQAEIQKYHSKQLIQFLVIAVIMMLALGLTIYFWVSRPLRLVSAGLVEKRPKSLNQLLKYRSEFGRIGELIGTFQDQRERLEREIEKHHTMDSALFQSEQRYRITSEQTGQMVYDWDMGSGDICWAGAIELLTGYTPPEFAEVNINAWEQMIHPEDRAAAMSQLDQAAKGSGKYCVEYRLRRKDGFYVIVEDTGVFLRQESGEPYRILGTMNDVTERKKAERVIRKSEAKYRSLFDTVTDAIVIAGADGCIIEVNAAACSQSGYSRFELQGMHLGRLSVRSSQELGALLEKIWGLGHLSYQTKLRKKNGETYPADLSVSTFDLSGQKAMLFVSRDITAQKAAEAELVVSEQRYRAVFEAANDAIFLMKDYTFVDCNVPTQIMFGCNREQIIGQPPYRFSPETQPDGSSSREGALEKIKAAYDYQPQFFEWRHCRADGTPFDCEVALNRLDIGDEVALLAIVRDITERKRAETQKQELQEKLERAQRMESLGVLAGGVAHDLNNMLGPVVGYSELLLRELEPGTKPASRARKIMKSAQDASDIIQDLLTLARRGRYEMAPLSLNDVITGYLESTAFSGLKARHADINVDLRLADNLTPICGSPIHLGKVVMNLVSNACEAMPTGGTLTIQTERRHMNTLPSGFSKFEHGDYIVLRVKDTGIGIKPEDLPKIFEPYYSKKKMGHSGSGLGLSVVYGVVKDHHGYYDVLSEIGQGTEFLLLFPVCDSLIPAGQVTADAVGGHERILVVDDSLEQRELAREIISSLGYQVDIVEHGHSALNYLKKQTVDLIVLDMIMEPKFDGLDTLREILVLQPTQKVIVVSGFSATERVQEMQRLGAGTYVRKPYTVDTLARALREQLDKPFSSSNLSDTEPVPLQPA